MVVPIDKDHSGLVRFPDEDRRGVRHRTEPFIDFTECSLAALTISEIHDRADDIGQSAGAARDQPAVNINPDERAVLADEPFLEPERCNGARRQLIEQFLVARQIIEANGVGFEHTTDVNAVPGGGLGLSTMRERAALVGGTFQVESRPGGGTTVYFEMGIDG